MLNILLLLSQCTMLASVICNVPTSHLYHIHVNADGMLGSWYVTKNAS